LPPRIMYVENKSGRPAGQFGVRGPGRIGRVTFLKSGQESLLRWKDFQKPDGPRLQS
jgi:hypothetical protein